MKYTEDQVKALTAINDSIDNFRGSIESSRIIYLIVFMLMWAKFIPKTTGKALGYFDVLEIITEQTISHVAQELYNETGVDMGYAEGLIYHIT